jgi:hypothetical protein
VTLRDQWEERSQWAEFKCWEAEQPPVDRAPGDIIAGLGFTWTWLPAEVRERDPDPEIGIQKMRATLALLKPRP